MGKKKDKTPKLSKKEKKRLKQKEAYQKKHHHQLGNLSALGNQVERPSVPSRSILETFDDPHNDYVYTIKHHTDEFTSMCPKTGQPDNAAVTITYRPRKVCVETKSLKLYLQSYRNTGAFMESVCGSIFKDLQAALDNPESLVVTMHFARRGGIGSTVEFKVEESK